MTDQLAVVRRMLACTQALDFEGLLDCFTDDLEYHYHVGTRPVNGKEKMRKFLRNYTSAYEQRACRIDAWATNGDRLMVEGVEELYDRKYDRIVKQPFMQAFEFRGDRIWKLRDYYDSANLAPPAPAVGE